MILPVSSVLIGIGILLLGNGFLGTLLGVRGYSIGFSPFTLGLIMSAYYLGYVAGTYWCPLLVRRVGYIRAFTALAAIASASALTHAVIFNPPVWMLLRFCNGVALFGLFMIVESWLNAVSTNRTRGRLFAVYMTVSLGAMAAGQFLLTLGRDDRYLPFALASLMITLSLVPVALTRVPAPETHPSLAFGGRKLYATSPLGFMGMLISGLANGAFWGLGAVFAQRHGLSPAQIAGFMASIIVGGALLQRPIGYFSDKFDRRRILRTVAFLAAAFALLLLLGTRLWLHVLFPAGFLYGGFAFAVYSLSVAHTNDHLVSEQILEATRGLLLVFGVGAAIGPLIAGAFMNLYEGGLIVYFLLNWSALGAFALHRESKSAPIPMEEQGRFALMRTSPVALELYPPTQPDPAPMPTARSNKEFPAG